MTMGVTLIVASVTLHCHSIYVMTMMMMATITKKNNAVITIWPIPLITPSLESWINSKVNGNPKITTQKRKRKIFPHPPMGVEPWYPETESKCATNELHWPNFLSTIQSWRNKTRWGRLNRKRKRELSLLQIHSQRVLLT